MMPDLWGPPSAAEISAMEDENARLRERIKELEAQNASLQSLMVSANAEIADLDTEVEELHARIPRWISVEERLPGKGQNVAFIPNCNPRSVYVGEISHVGKQGGVMFENRFSRTTMKYYATHWMPLPEPPKEAQS